MKRYYHLLGFTLLLSFLVNHALAQANYASVTNFEVLPQYLNPATGKIKIDAYSPTTTIKCKVSFVRTRGQFNSWNEANMIVGLVSATMQATTVFNETKHITEASFPNEVAYLNDVIMTVVLEKSKLGFGKIELMYARGPSFSNAPRYSTGYISNYELYYGDPVIGVPPVFIAPEVGSVPLYEYVSGNKRQLTRTYYSSLPEFTYKGILGYVFTSAATGRAPLYRYINLSNENHYYTINQSTPSGYKFDGIVCYVYENQISKTLGVYEHFKNVSGGFHLYSKAPGTFEYDGYQIQDIRFYILQNEQITDYPLPEEDIMELYEYYSDSYKDHFYTTEKGIFDTYYFVKVVGYVNSLQKSGTVPLYRYYRNDIITYSNKNHYYTTVKQNYEGYVYEGITGYVYTSSSTSGIIPFYEYYNYNHSVPDHYYTSTYSSYPGYTYIGVKFYMLQYTH